MATSNQATSIAKELAAQLTMRQPFATGQAVLAVAQSTDSDGYPLITVGPGTNGSRTAVIKVTVEGPYAAQTDSLGLTQHVYGPHKIMIAKEANYEGATDNVVDPLKSWDILGIYASCAKFGCKLEVWESAAGAAPTASTFSTASNRKAEWYPLVQAALVGQV